MPPGSITHLDSPSPQCLKACGLPQQDHTSSQHPPTIHPSTRAPAQGHLPLPATRHHQVLPHPLPRQSWCCLLFCSPGSTRSSISCSCGHSHTGQSELSGKQLPSCLIAFSGSLLPWGWGLNCLPSLVDSVVLQPY